MNSPPLVSPEAAELLRVEWQGVLRMRQRMQGLMTATFAGGAFTAPALSAVVYNLPLLLAFDVLKQALATARRERLFTSKRAQLGDMMDDSKDALAWLDWNALREGVRRRNRVAHDGELLEGAECIQDIERIELQLRAWGISMPQVRSEASMRPNPSFNPRLATAGAVSRVRARGTIVAAPAYSTRLRSRG